MRKRRNSAQIVHRANIFCFYIIAQYKFQGSVRKCGIYSFYSIWQWIQYMYRGGGLSIPQGGGGGREEAKTLNVSIYFSRIQATQPWNCIFVCRGTNHSSGLEAYVHDSRFNPQIPNCYPFHSYPNNYYSLFIVCRCTGGLHCKKRLSFSPSPAGMSLIKLSLGGNY